MFSARRLPGGKYKGTARKQMHMYMKYCLTAVAVSIDDHPVSIIGKAALPGKLGGCQQKVSEHRALVRRGFIQRVDMIARDDQDMCRSLRTQIMKGDAKLVLMNRAGRYAAVNYFAENTIVHDRC